MRIKQDKGVRASIDAVSAMCLLERYVEDEVRIGYLHFLPSSVPLFGLWKRG
jgi:hypothetical protein